MAIRTVLVVEDESDVREVLVEQLRGLQVDCLEAADGVEALEVLGKNSVTAILSDIHMPDLNGIQLLAKIQSDQLPVPVVFLTGYADTQNSAAALRLGAFDFIEKPHDKGRLLAVMGHALHAGDELQRIYGEIDRMGKQFQLPPEQVSRLKDIQRAVVYSRLAQAVSQGGVAVMDAVNPMIPPSAEPVQLLSNQVAQGLLKLFPAAQELLKDFNPANRAVAEQRIAHWLGFVQAVEGAGVTAADSSLEAFARQLNDLFVAARLNPSLIKPDVLDLISQSFAWLRVRLGSTPGNRELINDGLELQAKVAEVAGSGMADLLEDALERLVKD